MHLRQTNFTEKILLVVVLILLTSGHLTNAFAAMNRRFCKTNADCSENQCCTYTPIGYQMCLNYEKPGDICFFRSRTPTCGCSPGMKCVSTTPMEPGVWNHDYVCSRVRPFQHFKLMPYLEDINEVE